MKKWLFMMAALAGLPAVSALQAQSAGPVSLFEFFWRRPGPLPVLKLETDWDRLIEEKLKEEYQPGTLSFQGPDGKPATLEISARARGNTRKEVCRLPPLKIKAAGKQLKNLGFDPGSKLKMVLPCQDGKSNAECLLREALVYRLFELVYPIHHRTKLIEMEGWQDGKQKYSFYAFLVEEEDEFAGRLNGKRIKEERVNTIDLERDAYVKMCFFQYMIANTDWSAPNGHNLALLQLPGYDKIIAIPYDFDYAGLVDTDYAIPRSSIPIEDVSQRYFIGKYVTEEEALECARFYLSKKEDILQVCREFEFLRDKPKDFIQDFLAVFFDMLTDEEAVRRAFVTWHRSTKTN